MLPHLARFAAVVLGLPLVAHAQTTVCMSVDSFGNQPQGGSGGSGGTAISADRRHVIFDTFAWLVPGGGPALVDHDRLTGETVRIAYWGSSPSVSADGRFVAFETPEALDPADTNGGFDLYLWDRQTGGYEQLNVSTTGERAAIPWHYGRPSISADGRLIAFNSGAGNLHQADTYVGDDVFLRDRRLGTTTLLSDDGFGGYLASISETGDWVVFVAPADPVRLRLWSRADGSMISVSLGIQSPGVAQFPTVSRDGRFIVFELANAGGTRDVYLKDRQLDTTVRVSTPENGPGNGGGSQGRITPDGRYITFTGSDSRTYLVDRQAGTAECVSRSWSGAIVNGERHATTPDGRFTAFRSFSSNVVPNQTNPEPGIFLRDRLAVPEVDAFCFGDGSGTDCPCGNHSPSGAGAGCLNSTGQGAELRASGTASVSADSVLLHASGMPGSVCLFVRGTSRENGSAGSAFGDGLRCVAGTLTRMGTRSIAGGAAQFPDSMGALHFSGALAGVAQQYQVWYRNPLPAFCAPGTFNLSNGLTILWGP